VTKHTAANLADGFYVWKPPNRATASVAVQSRWGNLYDAPAAIRSLAVDVYSHACVLADIAAPEAAAVASRLPGPSLRLRAVNVPAPPFTGRCRVLLSLGEVTDLVNAHVGLRPGPDPGRDDMRVRIAVAVPGAVFGLTWSLARRPPDAVRQPVRTIRLLAEATVTGATSPGLGTGTGEFD
jgi:hypothetical protein